MCTDKARSLHELIKKGTPSCVKYQECGPKDKMEMTGTKFLHPNPSTKQSLEHRMQMHIEITLPSSTGSDEQQFQSLTNCAEW